VTGPVAHVIRSAPVLLHRRVPCGWLAGWLACASAAAFPNEPTAREQPQSRLLLGPSSVVARRHNAKYPLLPRERSRRGELRHGRDDVLVPAGLALEPAGVARTSGGDCRKKRRSLRTPHTCAAALYCPPASPQLAARTTVHIVCLRRPLRCVGRLGPRQPDACAHGRGRGPIFHRLMLVVRHGLRVHFALDQTMETARADTSWRRGGPSCAETERVGARQLFPPLQRARAAVPAAISEPRERSFSAQNVRIRTRHTRRGLAEKMWSGPPADNRQRSGEHADRLATLHGPWRSKAQCVQPALIIRFTVSTITGRVRLCVMLLCPPWDAQADSPLTQQ